MYKYSRLTVASLSLLVAFGLFVSGCGDDSATDEPGVQTGSVSGQVTEPASGDPISGAVVSMSPSAGKADYSTLTNATGRYTFDEVEVGEYTLTVDASAVTVDPLNADLEYVGFTAQISVRGGESTTADSFLPIVDTSEATDVTPGEPTVIESADIPGLRIEIGADAATFPDGSSTGSINVVQLGFDQGPSPVPGGWAPTMMIRILPEGVTFDPPASIRFPNRDDLEAGGVDLYRYDDVAQDWTRDGRLDAGGDVLSSEVDLLTRTSTHFVVCDATTVVGRVIDEQENSVEDARVTLWAHVSPFGEPRERVALRDQAADTDAAGNFIFTGIRACRVSIGATLDRSDAFGEIEPGEPALTNPEGTTDFGARLMDVRTETLFSLGGNITDTEGNPMVEAEVQYFDPNEQRFEPPRVWTNGNGDFLFEELEGVPGREMGLYVWHSPTGFTREDRFVVPPLRDSGTRVTRNVIICNNDEPFDFCGEPGDWQLIGTNTLRIIDFDYECGEAIPEQQDVTLIGLTEGDLDVQFEEEEGNTVTATFTRVSGSGPSGVSEANIAGTYKAAPEVAEGDEAYLVLFDDGGFNWLEPRGENPTVQNGTFTYTASIFTATFLESNELEGPPLNTPTDMAYTLMGNTLTIDDPGGQGDPAVFTRCAALGPQSGLEGMWFQDHGRGEGFALLLYDGEFVALERSDVGLPPNKGFWR